MTYHLLLLPAAVSVAASASAAAAVGTCCCSCCSVAQIIYKCGDRYPVDKRCWKEISTFTNVIPDFVAAAAAAVAAAAPDVAHLIRKTVLIKETFVLFRS